MNRCFTGFGNKSISFYTDDIADINQFFPDDIIKAFVFTGANIIAADIQLYFSMCILYHRKIGLAHIPYTHDAAGKAYIGKLLFVFFFIIFFYIS